MNRKRTLLIVIPILCIASLIIFTLIPMILEKQGLSFQDIRQKGWTTYLQENKTGGSESGARQGDMLTDDKGNVWIAGGAGLNGLHVFDGKDWASHPGNYNDLAIDPKGQIYAVHALGDSIDGVDVFDGQDWTTYEGPPGDYRGKQQILQVEVDKNGRIWIVTNDFGTERVVEMVIDEDKSVATFSPPEITINDGHINSLDADDEGNIWVAISLYDISDQANEWSSGLFIFNGENWENMSDQGIDLQQVMRTTFDSQGNAWVVTLYGAVMVYDGNNWETIIDENCGSDCVYASPTQGIAVDNQNRVWTWNEQSVNFLDNTSWIIFMPENSGFAEVSPYGPNITAVMIDDRDQVWIASGEGVAVGAMEEIQPTTETNMNQNARTNALISWMEGKNWLIPSILTLLWLALYLNKPRSVTLSLIISLFILLIMGPPIVKPFYGYSSQFVNPGFYIIFCCIVGGILGGTLNKTHSSKIPWDIIVIFFGLLIGFGLSIFRYILAVP